MANSAFSFSGLVFNLNNNESSNMSLSANTSTLCIELLELGNLFCVRDKYKSLKYGLFKYHTFISFIVTERGVPFSTFLCMIFENLSMSVCLGKYL